MIRNGIISNGTDHLRVTIWRMYGDLTHGQKYQFTDMNTRYYKYISVENSKETIIAQMDTDEIVMEPDLDQFILTDDTTKVDNVKILSIRLKNRKICSDPDCRNREIEVKENEKFVRCSCGALMNVDDLETEISGTMIISAEERKVTLHLSHELVSKFGYGDEISRLEMDLLTAGDLYLIYHDVTKKVLRLARVKNVDDQTSGNGEYYRTTTTTS